MSIVRGCSGQTTLLHTSWIAEASPLCTTVKMNESLAIKSLDNTLFRFYVDKILCPRWNLKLQTLSPPGTIYRKNKTVRLQFFAARGTLWNAPAADFWPKTRTVAGISETPPAHQTTAPNQATSSAWHFQRFIWITAIFSDVILKPPGKQSFNLFSHNYIPWQLSDCVYQNLISSSRSEP